jgi:hypothetical protein
MEFEDSSKGPGRNVSCSVISCHLASEHEKVIAAHFMACGTIASLSSVGSTVLVQDNGTKQRLEGALEIGDTK